MPRSSHRCGNRAVGASALWAAAVVGSLAGAAEASAYTIETQITTGCHESISADALRRVRATLHLGAPLPYTNSDDGPLVEDLPFNVPDDMKDIGGATLLLGVRDNDVKSLAATSLDQLAQVTADPTTQREHCLRTYGEEEPNGTALAVADCRAFIKEKLVAALDGLGPDGTPDVHSRDDLTVSLALSGQITVSVPRFYLRAGQAIHAIQDSFTHTFRSTVDQHQITVCLDWIHFANNTLNESTDGPPHMTELDRCDNPDALRTLKHNLAIEATTMALQIALDPTLSPDAKSAGFDRMLDTYVVFDTTANCTFANKWCNAPENQYRNAGCGCGVAGADTRGLAASMVVAALAGLALLRRRRRQSPSPAADRRAIRATLLMLGAVATPRIALAQETAPLPEAPTHAPQGPVAALEGKSESGKKGMKDTAGSLFGHVAVGASYDHAALAFAIGGKLQISQGWMAGLDVEWNPWIPTVPLSFRAGAGNVYWSVVRRYQMAYESVNLRTTAALGISTLLIDLPGAEKWSAGPLVGVSFLGVEWKIAPGYFLVVDPTYLVFAMPHLTGVPLGYYQYRFQVGIEFGG